MEKADSQGYLDVGVWMGYIYISSTILSMEIMSQKQENF
jgi:hypothetical protein